MSPFLSLSRPALQALAIALEQERLAFPVYAFALSQYVPENLQQVTAAELNRLRQQGMSTAHLAYLLNALAEERRIAQKKQEQVELVWTGPEIPGSESRDTRIVVQELFGSAQSSVLISSFAIDQGAKARELFCPLVKQMDANPQLSVRMFLNIKRTHKDSTPTSTLLNQFSTTFRTQIWSGSRLPEVFYDPRSLEMTSFSKACLHAKCVVVDEEQLLITSANFTEAAHERNYEAGVLIRDAIAAHAIRAQFETLVAKKLLCRVPGL
jgi:hypothetical protein